MITITNDYHNSAVTLRANVGDELSRSQIRRARAALCGLDGCTCGGPIGDRGRQAGFTIQQLDYDRVTIEPWSK